MKKITLLLCVVLALVMVTPAVAKSHQPSGDRIVIFYSGEQDFEADAPFYISHGFRQSTDYPLGRYDFKLEVDGIFIQETYVDRTVTIEEGAPLFDLMWIFNFPGGMSGVHTFRGHWYEPCQAALDAGLVDYCPNPNAPFEARNSEVVVTFVGP